MKIVPKATERQSECLTLVPAVIGKNHLIYSSLWLHHDYNKPYKSVIRQVFFAETVFSKTISWGWNFF